MSCRLILEDIQNAYEQLAHGEEIVLPPKTTAFKTWAERLSEYARSEPLREELEYWVWHPRPSCAPCPRITLPSHSVELARCVSVSLDAVSTAALLQEIPKVFNTQINEVLLAALAQALSSWVGTRSHRRIGGARAGRHREGCRFIPHSRLVYDYFPHAPGVAGGFRSGAVLNDVKEQVRRVPHRGIGYGLLRHLKDDVKTIERLRALPNPQVMFAYLGQFDKVVSLTPFGLVQESFGFSRDLQGDCGYLLEVSALVIKGRLQINWCYSENRHRQTTIEDLAQRFREALRSLIAHSKSQDKVTYVPSDFSAAHCSPS